MAHAVKDTNSRIVVDDIVKTWESQDQTMTPPRDGLIQMIQQIDEKHDDAHKRLRYDADKLEEQVNKGFESLRERIITIEKTRTDASKLVLSMPVIVTMIVMAIGIAATVWSVRSGMEKLSDKVDATAKLQEMQTSMLKVSIDEVKKRQELKQYDIQDLTTALNALKDKR